MNSFSFYDRLEYIDQYLWRDVKPSDFSQEEIKQFDVALAEKIYSNKAVYGKFDFGISTCRTFASIKTFAESAKMVQTSLLIEYILRLRIGDTSARRLPYDEKVLQNYPIQNQFTCTYSCEDRREQLMMKSLERLHLKNHAPVSDEPDSLQMMKLMAKDKPSETLSPSKVNKTVHWT